MTRANERKRPSVDQLLGEGCRALDRREEGRREAALLLRHVLGWDEARLWARGDAEIDAADADRYRELVARRAAGEPAAYLLGHREFWGRDFLVDPRVLIPRPETEHLVEAALEVTLPAWPTILDVGTGSGCLAVTLACERAREGARTIATDRSFDALVVARTNARRHGVGDRVLLVRADLLPALSLAEIDLVVSNPPYVDREIAGALAPEVVEHEPAIALFAADGGKAVLSALLDAARELKAGATMLLEIGFDQGDWLQEVAGRRPWLELVELRRDYAGHARVGVLRRA